MIEIPWTLENFVDWRLYFNHGMSNQLISLAWKIVKSKGSWEEYKKSATFDLKKQRLNEWLFKKKLELALQEKV